MAIAFSGDNLAMGTADGSIAIRNAATGAEIVTVHGDGPVESLALNASKKYVAASVKDKGTMVWDLSLNRAIARLPYNGPVSFSPDAKYLLTPGSLFEIVTADMIDYVCSSVRRRLTRDDWLLYLGEEDFRPACK